MLLLGLLGDKIIYAMSILLTQITHFSMLLSHNHNSTLQEKNEEMLCSNWFVCCLFVCIECFYFCHRLKCQTLIEKHAHSRSLIWFSSTHAHSNNINKIHHSFIHWRQQKKNHYKIIGFSSDIFSRSRRNNNKENKDKLFFINRLNVNVEVKQIILFT